LTLYVVDANVVAEWFVPERLSEECRLVTADERLVNALAGGPLASYVTWVGTPEQAP